MTRIQGVGAAAVAAVLLTATTSQAQIGGDRFLSAFAGDWSIDVDIELPGSDPGEGDPQELTVSDFGYSGLTGWGSFAGDEASLFRGHMYREWFYFRTAAAGLDDREYPLEALTLNEASNTNPSTGLLQDNLIYLDFGDPSVDPFGVTVLYELEETAPAGLGSTIRETVQVTNFTNSSQHLELFAYTDLDMDNFAGDDLGQLFSANTIRQTSFIGSTIDTRVAAGPNPNHFDVLSYDVIEFELDDDAVTNLGNRPSFGPGDVTHAFQWGIDLQAFGLDAGDTETIVIEKIGNFAEIALPEIGPNGEFIFNDEDPSTSGLPPTWYDPVVSVGYDYAVESGDNRFAELFLPGGFLDGEYFLEVLDPNHSRFGEVIPVTGDGVTISFDFLADSNSGASSFRITGIEPDASIDPADPLGFPTGLTFANSNAVQISQTALIIPEPAAWVLLALAGGPLLISRR